MAFLGIRIVASKLSNHCVVSQRKLCPSKTLAQMQVAFISGKHLRDKTVSKPAPFPYLEKKFTRFHSIIDNPLKRFDENTKLIVVEGNIASGKSAFAKQLAEDLDMMYISEANMESYYINDYGFDLRTLDPNLPEKAQSCDVKKFYQNPSHPNVAVFQMFMYRERFLQHVDALAHILNTGQGVVLERCAYSDFVFMEAMNKFKYLSDVVKNYYYEVKANTIGELMRPHLVIYLDVPVNIIQERIKKRGIDYEMKSNVLTKEYLTTLEDQYKSYLKDISNHAELLVYDWSNFGDVEVVVEDIERINFDRFDKYDSKMSDWRIHDYWDWVEKRYTYTTKRNWLLSYFNVPAIDVPEIFWPSDVGKAWLDEWYTAPGNVYEKGYNAEMGDKGLLFKTHQPPRVRPM